MMVVCSLDGLLSTRTYVYHHHPYPMSSSRLLPCSTDMHSTAGICTYMYQIAAAVIGSRRTLHVPAVACPLFPPIVHGARGHDELNVSIPYAVCDESGDRPVPSKGSSDSQ